MTLMPIYILGIMKNHFQHVAICNQPSFLAVFSTFVFCFMETCKKINKTFLHNILLLLFHTNTKHLLNIVKTY